MRKKALIFGCSGQDGSYLSEHLLSLGYDVYGTIRRNSVARNQESRIAHLDDKVKTYYADMLDQISLEKVISEIMPDEIYNLAAQSHVRVSFEIPDFTLRTNGNSVLTLLELYRRICPKAKFYQASSSEMFGNSVDQDGFQRETTPMHPVSPYGCSKLLAYSLVRHYRKSYGLHAVNGILFNHESPRRGETFVTNKVVIAAVKIKLGLQDKLTLGNMDSFRDWGHSKDYVKAMVMILHHDIPDEFVVSTGETHSVRQLCEYVFSELYLDYTKYVIQDEKLLRPEELKYLKGDCTKIKETLGWEPEYNFHTLLDEMIDYWMKFYTK
jgi:GDPmannose 4,6-dehydratase